MPAFTITWTACDGKVMQEEVTKEQLAEIAYDAWCRYCVAQTEAGVPPNEISSDDFIARELELIGTIQHKGKA